ncbi:unnamed protein product [Soboliphyme baturini]|uniref:Disks large homolog 2 n=1 Tax=Soboliphyme baturini TaxID=241478 RepID=A0A183IH31_9BILA|nr:unnamed protein product [Soboliphyme baturini]
MCVISSFKLRFDPSDIQEFYEETLLNEEKSLAEKTIETNLVADRWETNPPILHEKLDFVYGSKQFPISITTTASCYTRTPISTIAPSYPPGKTYDNSERPPYSSSTLPLYGQKSPTDRSHSLITGSYSQSNIRYPTGMKETWSEHAPVSAMDTRPYPELARNARYLNGGGSSDESWEYDDIVLEKGTSGLGVSISGGQDNPRLPNDASIYITKIIPGGAAAMDGRLRQGDVLLRVNNTDTVDVPHHVAVDALKRAGNVVKLQFFGLLVNVASLSGLGFSIAGGIGNEHLPNDNGIYVTKIIEGGAAQIDGRLQIGDKLLAVGNCSLANVTHETAVSALKATSDRVVLLIMKNPATSESFHSSFDHVMAQPEPTARLTPSAVTSPPPDAVLLHSYSDGAAAKSVQLSRQQEMRRALGGDAYSTSYSSFHSPEPPPPEPEHAAPLAPSPETPSKAFSRMEISRSPRYVTLTKNTAGLGFNIVGGESGEGIYISHILPGGVADLSGQLHRGDQILQVNDIDVRNASHEDAASALKNSGPRVTILCQYRPEEYYRFEARIEEYRNAMIEQQSPGVPQPRRELYVRALFDYDPTKDSGLPSRGLAFNYGDILHVTNASDDEWWQARKCINDNIEEGYGIVPSKKRVERKEKSRRKQVNFGSGRQASISEKTERSKAQWFFSSVSYVRPVIILGPLKDRINDDLISEFPESFVSCIPHTSRPQRDNEVDGRDYHFVTREQMERDIQSHMFIEAGQYNGNLYGTSIDAVKFVADQKKHCILDVGGGAIKRLQMAGLHPIALIVKAYNAQQLLEWNKRITEEEAYRLYQRYLQMEEEFGKYFTAIVQGNTPEEVYAKVKDLVRVHSRPTVWISSQESL